MKKIIAVLFCVLLFLFVCISLKGIPALQVVKNMQITDTTQTYLDMESLYKVQQRQMEQQQEQLELEQKEKQEKILDKKIRNMIKEMSLEDKAAQMLITTNKNDFQQEYFESFNVGGIILFHEFFARKYENEVIEQLESYQSYSNIPLLIGVDEEGGAVSRVYGFQDNPAIAYESAQDIYEKAGMEGILADTKEKSRHLKKLGINLNFAPVSDVATREDAYIYPRTFGKDAEATADYVGVVVKQMGEEKIGSCLKHFPGYGNNTDTHHGIVYDEREYQEFVEKDFIPFQAGIKNGSDMVMITHNIVLCMDESYPASLSEEVHQILRNNLGFEGVIITDDLNMKAIKKYMDLKTASVVAVQAGNDMMLTAHFKESLGAIVTGVEKGELTEERLEESVYRILKMKIKLGVML